MELFKVYAQDRVQPLLVGLIILVFSRVRAQQRFVELIILVNNIFSQDIVHLRLLAQVSSVVDVLKIFEQDRVQRRLGGGPGGVPVSIFPEYLSYGMRTTSRGRLTNTGRRAEAGERATDPGADRGPGRSGVTGG